MLEYYGAELVYFSPLHDKTLPDNIHGLLLGGGYPELYAKQLEENESMRKSNQRSVGTAVTFPGRMWGIYVSA